MSTRYEALGLQPVINASATLTKLGGSRMPDEVVAAMVEASKSYIDLYQLQQRAGEEIARQTGNEAAFITSGAAAGIALTVCSCIIGDQIERVFDFPKLAEISKKEIIVWKASRNGYDYSITQTGATVVEIGSDPADLEAAINANTAGIMYFAGTLAENALPLDQVVAIAKSRGVPVIVDAAAQIPPISSLWHYTKEIGATGAIFSGGKGLRGPQPAGLVVGSKQLIEGMRINSAPNQSFGRPMKVGKEEMVGLLTAIEVAMAQDEQAVLGEYDEIVHAWIEDLANLPGVSTERRYPSEAGQPHARTIVHLDSSAKLDRDALVDALWEGTPKIAVSAVEDGAIALNPQTLTRDEADIVTGRLRDLLG